ncbi:hypothetical protein ACFL4R_01195 [Nitrospirota bacterium]
MDLSKYDRLDNTTPLAEWVSEFLSRNDEFREDIRKHIIRTGSVNFSKISLMENILEKYFVHIPLFANEEQKLAFIEPETIHSIKLADPVNTIKLGDNLIEEIKDTNGEVIHIHETDPLEYLLVGGAFPGNATLLLAVNLKRSKKDIKDKIDEILDNYIPKQSRKRDEKWKQYIITYDLKEKYKLSFNEIADLFLIKFPDDEKQYELKNIRNNYKEAVKLIKGGYKKYI